MQLSRSKKVSCRSVPSERYTLGERRLPRCCRGNNIQIEFILLFLHIYITSHQKNSSNHSFQKFVRLPHLINVVQCNPVNLSKSSAKAKSMLVYPNSRSSPTAFLIKKSAAKILSARILARLCKHICLRFGAYLHQSISLSKNKNLNLSRNYIRHIKKKPILLELEFFCRLILVEIFTY